jgi:predicted HAD superfamily phosphohydrolase YqeG
MNLVLKDLEIKKDNVSVIANQIIADVKEGRKDSIKSIIEIDFVSKNINRSQKEHYRRCFNRSWLSMVRRMKGSITN